MITPPSSTKIRFRRSSSAPLASSVLIYVYFTFFLGPLNKSRANAEATITDLQSKIASSKSEMAKAKSLEERAAVATGRFAALKAMSPEGASIAWFPPRIKVLFANQDVEKVTGSAWSPASPSSSRRWRNGATTTGSWIFRKLTTPPWAAPWPNSRTPSRSSPSPRSHIKAAGDEPAISAGRPQRHFNSPKVMKKLVVPFLVFFSALPLGSPPSQPWPAETKTDEAQATPAAPVPVSRIEKQIVLRHGGTQSQSFLAHRLETEPPRSAASNDTVGPDILPASFPRQLHHRRSPAVASPSSTGAP